jgi:hypothetical protein
MTELFDYRKFHVLGEGFKRGAFRVHALGEIPDPFALARAEVVPKEPLRFHHDEGRRLYDFVGTTHAVLDLVSDRFVAVLRDSGFSGWATYKVEIYDEAGQLVPGYHGLAATGSCGPIDDSLSPVMPVPPPVPEGETLPHRIGLRFHPETWDGSDVFIPAGTAHLMVTDSVQKALVKAKLTNIRLDRITEVEMLVIDRD